MQNKNNHGFSIIALAIGLIFIGLIVGGVIFANYLRNSSEAILLIHRVSELESSVLMFKKTYRQFPGDSASFTPPGDDNYQLNDQLGSCARAPNDKLINEEKYQFWAHISQAKMLKDEEYEPFSPKSCDGEHDENWAAPEHAGILWPYVQLNPKAAAVFGAENGSKSPFAVDSDPYRKALFLAFSINAAEAIPFAHKFAKEAHAANKIDLVNEYGVDMCKTAGGVDDKGLKIPEFVNCKDKHAALAKFVYYIRTE